ncbi:unnamed protein product, partial [Effrenium voratum]
DEEVFVAFLKRVNGGADPTQIQVARMRRLFYESHTLALSDLKQRVESGPDPAQQTRRLPTAERVARQNEQETRLAGIVFSLEVMPSHRFVEMAESGILAYISPDNCTSRAQEVQCVKKDAAISLDSAGVLKLHNKSADLVVDTGTEVRLRSAWLRRSLAMDQAGLVKFQTIEKWVQYLFLQLCKDQPKNFSKVTLHQIVECDKQLFTLASLQTMGTLSAPPAGQKPLDGVIDKLSQSNEVLQYLMPLPQTRSAGSPDTGDQPPAKKQRVSPKGGQKGTKDGGKGKYSLPDGCVAKDDQNRAAGDPVVADVFQPAGLTAGVSQLQSGESSMSVLKADADEIPQARALKIQAGISNPTRVHLREGRLVSKTVTLQKLVLMGHHVKPGMKSVLTYSREAYTALYGKVLAMFAKIRAGSFNPDLPAVDRVLQAAQSSACGPPSEHTDAVQEPAAQDGKDSSSESSIDSEADIPADEDALASPADDQLEERTLFPGLSSDVLIVHTISGVTHVVNEDGFSICGRNPSVKFCTFNDVVAGSIDLEECMQCNRALQKRKPTR